MYFRGSSPSAHRLAAYEAKVRAYTGTGTAPIIQQKLNAKCRSAQKAFGGEDDVRD